MKRLKLTTLLILTFCLAQSQSKNFIDQPYIEVSGSADTLVTPNEIFIRISLSERDTRDKVSLEELERKLVSALKGLGLDTEKDLTTADINSNFRHFLLKSKDVIKAKTYMLKVRDAVTASKVFIKMEELGISNTFVDRVDHSEIDAIRNMMRASAITNAKARATALTKPLNQTVGQAIYIADVENYNGQAQGRIAGVVIRGAASVQNDANLNLPNIDFEKIKVTANINAKFILK